MPKLMTLLAVGGLLMPAPALSGDTPSVDWLFIQGAAVMRLDETTLRLDGVRPETLAFSDRPYRLALDVPTRDFLDLWSDPRAFASNPPNAGLSGTAGGKLFNAVVTLGNPRFEADVLVYDVSLVGGDLPGEASDVTLLIDAMPTPVNDQITDSVTETNTQVLGDAPAEGMGNVYQTLSRSAAVAMQNATGGN